MIQTRSIEVVDWEENVDDIMKVIKKKCKRAYPDHYLLLVNARHGKGYLDFDRVIEEMKAIPSPFLEVWVVVDGRHGLHESGSHRAGRPFDRFGPGRGVTERDEAGTLREARNSWNRDRNPRPRAHLYAHPTRGD